MIHCSSLLWKTYYLLLWSSNCTLKTGHYNQESWKSSQVAPFPRIWCYSQVWITSIWPHRVLKSLFFAKLIIVKSLNLKCQMFTMYQWGKMSPHPGCHLCLLRPNGEREQWVKPTGAMRIRILTRQWVSLLHPPCPAPEVMTGSSGVLSAVLTVATVSALTMLSLLCLRCRRKKSECLL